MPPIAARVCLDITRGPIGRVVLPQQVPTGTHAFWAPESMLGDG